MLSSWPAYYDSKTSTKSFYEIHYSSLALKCGLKFPLKTSSSPPKSVPLPRNSFINELRCILDTILKSISGGLTIQKPWSFHTKILKFTDNVTVYTHIEALYIRTIIDEPKDTKKLRVSPSLCFVIQRMIRLVTDLHLTSTYAQKKESEEGLKETRKIFKDVIRTVRTKCLTFIKAIPAPETNEEGIDPVKEILMSQFLQLVRYLVNFTKCDDHKKYVTTSSAGAVSSSSVQSTQDIWAITDHSVKHVSSESAPSLLLDSRRGSVMIPTLMTLNTNTRNNLSTVLDNNDNLLRSRNLLTQGSLVKGRRHSERAGETAGFTNGLKAISQGFLAMKSLRRKTAGNQDRPKILSEEGGDDKTLSSSAKPEKVPEFNRKDSGNCVIAGLEDLEIIAEDVGGESSPKKGKRVEEHSANVTGTSIVLKDEVRSGDTDEFKADKVKGGKEQGTLAYLLEHSSYNDDKITSLSIPEEDARGASKSKNLTSIEFNLEDTMKEDSERKVPSLGKKRGRQLERQESHSKITEDKRNTLLSYVVQKHPVELHAPTPTFTSEDPKKDRPIAFTRGKTFTDYIQEEEEISTSSPSSRVNQVNNKGPSPPKRANHGESPPDKKNFKGRRRKERSVSLEVVVKSPTKIIKENVVNILPKVAKWDVDNYPFTPVSPAKRRTIFLDKLLGVSGHLKVIHSFAQALGIEKSNKDPALKSQKMNIRELGRPESSEAESCEFFERVLKAHRLRGKQEYNKSNLGKMLWSKVQNAFQAKSLLRKIGYSRSKTFPLKIDSKQWLLESFEISCTKFLHNTPCQVKGVLSDVVGPMLRTRENSHVEPLKRGFFIMQIHSRDTVTDLEVSLMLARLASRRNRWSVFSFRSRNSGSKENSKENSRDNSHDNSTSNVSSSKRRSIFKGLFSPNISPNISPDNSNLSSNRSESRENSSPIIGSASKPSLFKSLFKLHPAENPDSESCNERSSSGTPNTGRSKGSSRESPRDTSCPAAISNKKPSLFRMLFKSRRTESPGDRSREWESPPRFEDEVPNDFIRKLKSMK